MVLTATEVVALQPQLRLIATVHRFNGVERDDLVQAASLELLTTTRKFTNPIVFSVSVMKDYCRKHGYDHYKNTKDAFGRYSKKAVGTRRVNSKLIAKKVAADIDGEIWWSNFKLRDDELTVAKLYIGGTEQPDIAKQLGRSASWVSKVWNSALNTIKNRWTKQYNIEIHMTVGTLRSATKHAQISTEVMVEIAGKQYRINNWRLDGNPKGHPEADPPTLPTTQVLVLEAKK